MTPMQRKIITVASHKGGCAKTTTATELAFFFSSLGPTLLVDGDPNRSATSWAKRGSMPFKVVSEREVARWSALHEWIVVDTKARAEPEDLQELAAGCNLMVLPTVPDSFGLDALNLIVRDLRRLKIPDSKYKVLLAIVPPPPNSFGAEARESLPAELLFQTTIPRAVVFQKAVLDGVSVGAVKKDRRAKEVSRLYEELGREIIAHLGSQQ